MLKQVPLEADMRYNRLVVTDLGKAMIDDYKEYVIKVYQDIFQGFNEEELEKLFAALIKINDNLSKINNNVDKN